MLTALQASALAFSLIQTAIAVAIGQMFWRRPLTGADVRASRSFAVFWLGAAAAAILNDASVAAGANGGGAMIIAPLTYANLLADVLYIGGLVYYLLYIYTGRASLFPYVVAFYAAALAGALALIASLGPTGMHMNRWGGSVAYQNEPSAITALLFAVFFLLPPIVGSILYGTLYFRVHGRTQRWRVGLVSTSLFIWVLSALLVTAFDSSSANDAAAIAIRCISVAAMATIYAAYAPPAWVQRRFEIESLQGEVARALPAARSRPPDWRIVQFHARLRELV
ncbi:MAG: hypothetical protein ACYDDF_03965 [Thermoplasmatota archaeon]